MSHQVRAFAFLVVVACRAPFGIAGTPGAASSGTPTLGAPTATSPHAARVGTQRSSLLREPLAAAAGPEVPGDYDNDGRSDSTDNCVFTANASQTDTDGDGLGDACDSFPSGGPLTFGSEVLLPRPDIGFGFDHFPTEIGVDPSGRIYVLLGTGDPNSGSPRNLWLTKSTDGGATWSTAVQVNANDGVFWYNRADMAVDDAGRIHLVWDRQNGQITYARSIDQGLTFTYTTIVGSGGSSGYCAVAAYNNRVYVVYDTQPGCPATTQIKQRRSSDGGATFGAATTVRTPDACLPEVSISKSDQKVRVTWGDGAVTGYVAVATSSDFGVSYGAPVQVKDAAPGVGVSVNFPAMIEEGSPGVVHTGWNENNPDTNGVYSYSDYFSDRSANGGTSYNTDIRLTNNITHPATDLNPGSDQWDLVSLSNGTMRRVVRDGIKGRRHVYYTTSSDGGATYHQPQPVGPPVADYGEATPFVERTSDDQTLVTFSRVRTSIIEASKAYFVRTNASAGVGEATNLKFDVGSKTTFRWIAATGASNYDVAKGGLKNLQTSTTFAAATGLSCNQAGLSATDPATPASTDGFYYLARGRSGATKGTWGTSKQNTEITACP